MTAFLPPCTYDRYEGCSYEIMFNFKKVLKNCRFRSDKSVEAMVMEQFQQQSRELFPEGIKQLLHQWGAYLSTLKRQQSSSGLQFYNPHRYNVMCELKINVS
jgi:hypothetical protein